MYAFVSALEAKVKISYLNSVPSKQFHPTLSVREMADAFNQEAIEIDEGLRYLKDVSVTSDADYREGLEVIVVIQIVL